MREVDEEGFAIRPNKTQLKRELAQLRELIVALMQLPDTELAQLPLSGQFLEQLKIGVKMKPSSGRNRQIKYLAKLLQAQGAEPVREWLETRDSRQAEQNRQFHQLEQWRERLIDEGDGALKAFLDAYPHSDRQQLRQAIRNAVRERQQGKPAGASKKLFRLLREISAEQRLSATFIE